MAVRNQRSTTKEQIIESDIKIAAEKGKRLYRNVTDEFYVFETYTEAGYYFPESERYNSGYIQHWKFNENKKRWECIEDNSN